MDLSGKMLVVGMYGHVWLADQAVQDGPDWFNLIHARIVRRWGTSEGLNQLAVEGLQENTQLDAPADIRVNRVMIIYMVPMNQDSTEAG